MKVLETLIQVQQMIPSRLDLEVVMQSIADGARRLTGSKFAGMYLVEGNFMRLAVLSRAENTFMDVQPGYKIPLDQSVAGEAVRLGKTILVTDVNGDGRVYQDAIERTGIRSFLIVPLMSNGEPLGVLTAADKIDGPLGQGDEHILNLLASSAVIGLENARHFREERERRRIAESLRDILAILNSNQPSQEILDYLVGQSGKLLNAAACLLVQIPSKGENAILEAAYNLHPDLSLGAGGTIQAGFLYQPLLEHEPVRIPDLAAEGERLLTRPELTPDQRAWYSRLSSQYRAVLGVPLLVRGQFYGGMLFTYQQPRRFSGEEVRLALTLGEHAALAIENARLRAQVEQAAVENERSRIARDLHDAVTQTLFSASLIADVMPKIWARDPTAGAARLDDLRQLVRGALAEMRTLLMEMRPESLHKTDIQALLTHLSDAFVGRMRLPVSLDIEAAVNLAPEVKTTFYRIAQEALNNIARHSGARQVRLRFSSQPGQACLLVSDDGLGFEPDQVPAGHFGLAIMKERAANIGAEVKVHSQVGKGTTILVTWEESPLAESV